ncbi:helix-turn-helix domain-containing protein [Arcticibacter eurypsychrophilus]|uniref:helix-turn-helix domain-containing protein n=1 Tax=Arcticibacter eurypsychrophilus TaxID=1434752 RepID=UPI00084D6629|nr:helix-turn-helix transcriptional regulator [Arcticibacter eurypsychrophilus]
MSVILGIDNLSNRLTAEQLEELDLAADVHKSQSNIEFNILKVKGDVIYIESTQSETRSGKYATEATLLKKTHEVFDKWLPDCTIKVETLPHLPSPTSVVNPVWLEKKMKEKGIRIKQIAFDTGVDRESISEWTTGKRSMSQIVKAMFFFYFLK